jgi:hypothetical protein
LGDLHITSKKASNWVETKEAFIADNLQIYYGENFDEWILKETSPISSTELTTIKNTFEQRRSCKDKTALFRKSQSGLKTNVLPKKRKINLISALYGI